MSLRISTAPHMHNPLTTQRLMQYVCIALLPTAAWGVYAFGLPALLVLGISMAGSVLAEFVWQKIAKQPVRINDFSALVTGLILGLNLPATAPWWMVLIGGTTPEAALAAVLSGGVLFGAVFMATDYVTSPITPWGQVIYAIGIGLIITLIRQFGSYPEGVTYGILLMNIATPLIDRLPRKIYGIKKEAKKA